MNKIIDFEKSSWQWIALIFLAFIWGSSFILMKKGLLVFDYMQVAALRIFISFLSLAPIALKNLYIITRKNLKSFLIVGFIGSGIPAFLFTLAQTRIDSSLAGMLNSLTPFFTLLIGTLFFGTKVWWKNALGVLLGLIGASGLIYKGGSLLDSNSIYGLLVVLATICYGTNVNEVKYHLKGIKGLHITALGFLMVGPFAGLYLLFADYSNIQAPPQEWLQALGYISILAIVGTAMSLVIFNALIAHTTALFASSVTYIIPVFAIMWGLFDGEIIGLRQFLAIGIIMLGVYLVNSAVKKQNELINRESQKIKA